MGHSGVWVVEYDFPLEMRHVREEWLTAGQAEERYHALRESNFAENVQLEAPPEPPVGADRHLTPRGRNDA